MTLLLALVALGAEPKIASTPFACSEQMGEALCSAYSQRFAVRLGKAGTVKVITAGDISALLGLERQKELLGCADETTSCSAELIGALGADALLLGSIIRTPGGYLLTFKALKVKDGTTWAEASERAAELEVQDRLDLIARRFSDQIGGRPHAMSNTRRFVFAGVGAAGLAATVLGSVFFGIGKSDAALLRSEDPQSPTDLMSTASHGSLFEGAGMTMLVVGIPLLLVGGLLAAFLPPQEVDVIVSQWVSPHGNFAAVLGALR